MELSGECPGRNVWVQDYKSLCAVIMICDTLVSTHTHKQLLTGYIISRHLSNRVTTVITN